MNKDLVVFLRRTYLDIYQVPSSIIFLAKSWLWVVNKNFFSCNTTERMLLRRNETFDPMTKITNLDMRLLYH